MALPLHLHGPCTSCSTVLEKLPRPFLGACDPPLAHQALEAELEIGLMLPCNLIVYETDDGHAVVSAVDPTSTLAAVGSPKLGSLAAAVKEKLARVIAALGSITRCSPWSCQSQSPRARAAVPLT